MWYVINCWIPVTPGESGVYEIHEEAETDLGKLESMQPVIIYEIEEALNFRLVKTLGDTPTTQFWKGIRWGKGL